MDEHSGFAGGTSGKPGDLQILEPIDGEKRAQINTILQLSGQRPT